MDLPQPDGPITATNSPRFIVKSTPRSARTGAPSDSKFLRSPRVTRIGLSSVMVLLLLVTASSDYLVLERAHRRLPALDRLLAERLALGRRAIERDVCRLAEHEAATRAGEVLQPLCEVHRVADERVLQALFGAEQTRRRPVRSRGRCRDRRAAGQRSAHSTSSFACASSIETAAANTRSA